MKRFNSTFAILTLATIVLIPAPAMAQVSVNIFTSQPPPAVRYEANPPPRSGYLWTPGYWNWNGQRHDWVQGRWVAMRSGQQYQRAEWLHENEGWRLREGSWKEMKKQQKRDQKEARHQAKFDHEDQRGNGHCPPGHAKKGEC